MKKQLFSIQVKTEAWPHMLSRLHLTFNRKSMNMIKVQSETQGDASWHSFDFFAELEEQHLKLIARQVYRIVGILSVELYLNNEKLNYQSL